MIKTESLKIPAVCICYAVGSYALLAQPIWVAAFVRTGVFTTERVGWLASGELGLFASSTLVVSAWGGRFSPRAVATLAASIIAVANVAAMVPVVEMVVFGRLLSGVGAGAVVAATLGSTASRPGAQRVIALMQAASVLLASGVYFASPLLVAGRGPERLFALMAAVGGIGAVMAWFGLARVIAPSPVRLRLPTGRILAPLLACLALMSVGAGTFALWTFVVVIGNKLGFDARTVGNVLAAVSPVAILGPIAAHLLGERLGLLPPLFFAMAVAAVDFFLLVNAPSAAFFGVCAAMLLLIGGFKTPYGIALVGRLDNSGRFAAATPAFLMGGTAIGPTMGGKVMESLGVKMLAPAAASCVSLGILMFWGAAVLGGVLARRDAQLLEPMQPTAKVDEEQ